MTVFATPVTKLPKGLVTKLVPPEDPIETTHGILPGAAWLQEERIRLARKGQVADLISYCGQLALRRLS